MTNDVGTDGGSVTLERGGHGSVSLPDRAEALPSLSVVVITHNEEGRIETCLNSVFEACRDDPEAEVILVDSNSTDRTVALARQYPIEIRQIPTDDLSTPGAGRYVGHQVASGDHVLFVDGDMNLSREWLLEARRFLAEHDGVGGVDGHLNATAAEAVESVNSLRGVALYEGDALDAVDGFDPFLRAVEDRDLGYRITAEGYEIRRLPLIAASHPFAVGLAELRRRWENGYYFAVGQAIRKYLRTPGVARKLLARYRYAVLFACWLLLGAIVLVAPVFSAAWLATSLVIFVADVAWEGRARAFHRLGNYLLLTIGFVPGFLIPPRDHADFPLEATVQVQPPEAEDA